NLCRNAILSLERAKIKAEDFQKGTINAVNGSGWKIFWGTIFWGTIDFNLLKINENLTEIEFSICPVIKTAIISDGRSWEIAEDICDYIKDKDAEINKRVLADSVGIMEDIYVKPFRKEKV
ncbi:MAG TPA: hypothetical protein VNB22_21310, partial [Pyrinomonadaceae bacterium]|nr:hypothetical protein [Pyrinomonadaceae bacterium]